MRIPWRRERVPDDVRGALSLQRGERVLATCRSGEDSYLVATERALYRVTPPTSRRLRWDLIDRAGWEPPLLNLQARTVEANPAESVVWEADRDGELPAVVRDRVTNSILVSSRVAVAGGSARVVARRNADTGDIKWRVVFGAGVDPEDPDVRVAAEGELADLRSRFGV